MGNPSTPIKRISKQMESEYNKVCVKSPATTEYDESERL